MKSYRRRFTGMTLAVWRPVALIGVVALSFCGATRAADQEPDLRELKIAATPANSGDAAQWRDKGIAALRESQTDPQAIVAAARAFAKAAEFSERAGDTEHALEANSFLFWCRKKMSLQDIEELNRSGESATAAKLKAVDAVTVPATDAQTWLARADQFAAANPGEHLLIAIRYFEIADRFKGTPAGLSAMERSLKEMQTVLATPAAKTPPAVPAPPAQPPAPAESALRRGNRIDLLALLRLDADVVSGSWHLKEKGLTVEKSSAARVEFPYRPPQEYDYKIVFTCVAKPAQVNQILTGGGHSFSWIMGANKGQYDAIETIAGHDASNNSTTIKQKQSLEPGRTYVSVVEVRKDRVHVSLDGRTVADLRTDFKDLGIVSNWKLRDETLLGLGSHNTATVIHAAEVTEISGKGTFVRTIGR